MRPQPVPPATRTARALIFALVCVLLSAAGHAHLSQHALPASALVLAFAGIGAMAWAVADRQRGLCAIIGGLLVMQAALHLWFGVAAVSGGHVSAHGAHAAAGADAGSFAMVAAHCTAALICGLWLWCGERALFALLRALYTRVLAPLLLLFVHPCTIGVADDVRAEVGDRAPLLRDALLRYSIAQRGPPACPIFA